MAGARPFRTDESIAAEAITRDAVPGLLERFGFTVIEDHRTKYGTAVSQAITARTPTGEEIRMHVRICWRRDPLHDPEGTYSAAQLRASRIDNDWDATLDFIERKEREQGNSYNLIVQYDKGDFASAALIPSDQLGGIWRTQRQESDRLIAAGKMGRIRKNHAANGDSPTLWLHDSRTEKAHEVPDVLWSWPGVVNILSLPQQDTTSDDDAFDDLSFDYQAWGRDQGERVKTASSGFKRDPKVRAEVARRANGRCEQAGCGEHRSYDGFLDVHHILTIAESDRPWTCVALCPNCHREAHVSPDRDAINHALAAFAERFAPAGEIG